MIYCFWLPDLVRFWLFWRCSLWVCGFFSCSGPGDGSAW